MKTYIIEENGEEIRRFTQDEITEKFIRDQRVKGRTVIELANPAKPADTEDNTWERGDLTDTPTSLGDETYLVRERPWVSAPFSAQSIFNATIDAGYAVEPEGFTIGMAEQDRKNFAELAVMLREAEEMGTVTAESDVTIHDATGTKRTISLSRYRQIIVGLGSAYKAAFDLLHA